jgi:signal transduction histidine kinase
VSDGALRLLDGSPRLGRGGDRSLVARVLDGGAPVLSHPSEGVGGGSCIVVPLNARGRTVGAVTLVALARAYGSDDLQLCLELAHRVALALENARLYDEARRAVRVRDDVLAIVSHDLRNPLSTILTSTERLLTRDIDDARPSIERCRRAAQRMTRLITDLVDAASLDSGTLSLDRRSHDVGRVLQDAVDLLQPLAEARGHTLMLEGDGFMPPALCDRERVVQVLSNLVGNALKFSPTPSTVRIAAHTSGEMVRVSVADSGPGIAPELLPHIFERYWHTRLDNRTGAGLGLYIAKGIVEGHGGRIWVDTNPAGGSTFHFTLPTVDTKALHATH